ncbi:hypothetical protein RND81_03G002100 [Saponaria officinalis]|uniref:UVR domain-containing protein n=1 Tax=Saponaria officinalis TaxID=3572 RepID=A0AAW1M3H3_SAPOF
MSTSTLTCPGRGGLCRSTHSRSSIKRTLLLCGAQRNPIWKYSVCNPLLRGQLYRTGQRCVKVEAGWLFKGGGADKGLEASIEFSESANEDILVFFFQLDLATRVQYALNLDQFDIAQQLRNKLTEVYCFYHC